MNRNVESHFSELPHVDLQRSIFDRSSTHKTSLNFGDLVPVYIDEVLPGDSFRMTTSKVIRLQTLLTPVMDNAYADFYWFFVPNRLTWDHWQEFCGENTTSAWIPQVSYQIPSISSPVGGFNTGTLADYFGLPVGVEWDNEAENRPSALPFRAYALICNEFFRDENLTDPLNIPTGDSNQTGSNGTSYINDVVNGGAPFKVAKYHDYFTSCLPSPQKGQAVEFSFNPSVDPIGARTLRVLPIEEEYLPESGTSVGRMKARYLNGTQPLTNTQATHEKVMTIGSSPNLSTEYNYVALQEAINTKDDSGRSVYFSNLAAELPDLSSAIHIEGVSFGINELRLAFQLQKYYEKNARGGTRYIEILKQHFGVTSPDSRLQRPEYLGGNRVPIAVHEVTNSAQSQTDFLGDLGAMSLTSDINDDFEHSFTEHGYLMCVMCLRYDHSYPQGLEKMWTRRNFTDFYLPVFANIGEQPVDKSEIYADATTMDSKDVFGYQEAWAEYRYKPDRVSAEMRPGIQNTLAAWHFADYYQAAPTLSDLWIREDKTNVDRTLAVTSSNSNQAWCDIYFKCIATRCMPMYSVPGLIDHH